MIRKAKAVWRGTGRAGSGDLSTDSGAASRWLKENNPWRKRRSLTLIFIGMYLR